MPRTKNDAVSDFFEAANALTYTEMLDVAALIGLQLAEVGQDLDGITASDVVAKAIIDAGKAHAEADED